MMGSQLIGPETKYASAASSVSPRGASDDSPRRQPWVWSLDVFDANSNESTGLAHRNNRFVPQRMEMSTKRLFHYKQEMRAFDW